MSLTLKPTLMIGSVTKEAESIPIPESIWYSGNEPDTGLEYHFPTGALAKEKFLSADVLLDGKFLLATGHFNILKS